MLKNSNLMLLICFSILFFNSVYCQDNTQTYDIVLDKTKELKQVYHDFKYFNPSSKIIFNIQDNMDNKNISFLIFQVHTFEYNITLSYNSKLSYNSSINGTNVGLYSKRNKMMTFYVNNFNREEKIKGLISIIVYTFNDPIPGGCNMVLPISTSPFLISEFDAFNETVSLTGAPAMVQDDIYCTKNTTNLNYDYYQIVLKDMTEDEYFNSLQYMLTVDNITLHAEKICNDLNCVFATYPQMNTIYALIVSSNTEAISAYVPARVPSNDQADQRYDDEFSRTLCGILMLICIFLSYFGHTYFKTEMFLMAFLTGLVVTYIVLSVTSDFDRTNIIWLSLPMGVICGWIWLLVWVFYGIPLISVTMVTLNMGFLIACMVYSFAPALVLGDIYPSDLNFWTKFILVILVSSWCLLLIAYHANLLACAILGSYGIIFSLDVYLGSNMKYIIIDVIRRAVNPRFKNAVVWLPFQWTEAILTLTWVLLAMTGYLVQHYHNRGKSSFPLPRARDGTSVTQMLSQTYSTMANGIRNRISGTPNENTPLLS